MHHLGIHVNLFLKITPARIFPENPIVRLKPTHQAAKFRGPKFRGHNTKLLISPFFPWTFRSGLFIPELFSRQHFKLVNARIIPKRPAGSPMLTESLIFFLKFVF